MNRTVTLLTDGGPLEITTYRDIPAGAQFSASGVEGEEVAFAVETEPKKGAVEIEGDTFTYTPKPGVSGNDSFTYTATDSQGRTSLPAKVTITIEKTRSGVQYNDMENHSAASAAQHLAEAGIFTGIFSHGYGNSRPGSYWSHHDRLL